MPDKRNIVVDTRSMSDMGRSVLFEGGDFGVGGDEAPVTVDGRPAGKAGWLDYTDEGVAVYCTNGNAIWCDYDELTIV